MILLLILLFVIGDFLLFTVFFVGLYNLSIIINKATHRILFSYLFNFGGQTLNNLPGLIHVPAQLLTQGILFFQEVSVVFHSLIFSIALAEHVERFGAIGQVLQAALHRRVDHLFHFLQFLLESLVALIGALLIQFKFNSPFFYGFTCAYRAVTLFSSLHHLKQGITLFLALFLFGWLGWRLGRARERR